MRGLLRTARPPPGPPRLAAIPDRALLYNTQTPQSFRYGACAIIAMFHDLLVTMGIMAILGIFFGWEVDALFLTAILTVVVCDRGVVLLADDGVARVVRLFGDSQPAGRPGELRTFPVEKQRVLSQSKGTVFAQIAREGRKFKVGFCAVSQQPKLINEEIISQFNTLFILGLADKRDRDILRNSAKQDISMLDNEIQMLMPGEALIASPFTPFAIPCKVHLYEEYVEESNAKAGERKNTVKKDVGQTFF